MNLTTYNAWSYVCIYIYIYIYIYISIFVCPVVDTTLLYVCTLWLGILLTVDRWVVTPLRVSISCANCFFKNHFLLHLLLKDKLTYFFWAWIGTTINRELEDNYYSEEVRKDCKVARCNGLL